MKLLPLRLHGMRSHATTEVQEDSIAVAVRVNTANCTGQEPAIRHPGSSIFETHNGAGEAADIAAGPPAARLLDLPPALLQEILAHASPGSSRTGAALPFVCRAFRQAVSDCRHERLWRRLDPELCRIRTGIQWPGLRKWLAARAGVIRHLVLPAEYMGQEMRIHDEPDCRNIIRALARLSDMPHLISLELPLPGLWGPEEVDAASLSPLSRLSSLQRLQLTVPFTVAGNGGWGFLQAMPQLSYLHLTGRHNPAASSFDFRAVSPLRELVQLTVLLDHDGAVGALAEMASLRSFTIQLPTIGGWGSAAADIWESFSGLDQLHELIVVPFGQASLPPDWPALPSNAALASLTALSRLEMQVAGVKDEGIIESSALQLSSLASLSIRGHAAMGRLPQAMSGLTALTELQFEKVYFGGGGESILSEGLQTLQVLKLHACTGGVPIGGLPPRMQLLQLTECDDLSFHPGFLAGLRAPGSARCEVLQAWQNDWTPVQQLLPAVALALPRLHSIIIHNPPAWIGLPSNLAFDQLLDVDLQACALRCIPHELQHATRLQRLRIVDDMDYLTLGPAAEEVLTAMQGLTFLSIAKPAREWAKRMQKAQQAHHALPLWQPDGVITLLRMLWRLRARHLLVVLREPSDVMVPLDTAAATPADVPGRCAISTQLAAALCKSFAGASTEEFGQRALVALRAWLDLRFPHLDPRFSNIADRDGAAMLEHWQSSL